MIDTNGGLALLLQQSLAFTASFNLGTKIRGSSLKIYTFSIQKCKNLSYSAYCLKISKKCLIFSRHLFLKVELIFNHFGTKTTSLSLKIVEKVSFDIASEASYIYILSGQTVLPDRSISIGQKIVEKCQNSKIQMRHFELFSNIVYSTIPNMKEYRSALI